MFFWWLEGFLSVEKHDIIPILEKMKEIKEKENIFPSIENKCVCGYNHGEDDCNY